jgi:hypothetical protein
MGVVTKKGAFAVSTAPCPALSRRIDLGCSATILRRGRKSDIQNSHTKKDVGYFFTFGREAIYLCTAEVGRIKVGGGEECAKERTRRNALIAKPHFNKILGCLLPTPPNDCRSGIYIFRRVHEGSVSQF